MSFLKRFLLFTISLTFFSYIIYFTEPPKSWDQASNFQILIFFIPLLLLVTFFTNLFLNYLPRSFSIGLGVLVMTVLKGVNQLNSLTFSLTILLIALLFWFIPKSRLTRIPKIPKLSRFRRK